MSTAIATEKKEQRQLTIKEQLQNPSVIDQIRKALPAHMSADRMARIAMTALTRTPKLSECTQQSFFKCLLDLSSWGLEPDGRHAHLIPYGKDCTLILDFKGIVALAYRSGFVKNIHSDVVYAGDVFEYSLGKVQRHTPWDYRLDDKPANRGDIVAAYCIVEMKDDAVHHEVMTKAEIDSIKSRSRAGSNGPWVTDYPQMARKTVFRRASKWLPLSAEIQDAFERDDDRLPPIQQSATKRVEVVGLDEIMEGEQVQNG